MQSELLLKYEILTDKQLIKLSQHSKNEVVKESNEYKQFIKAYNLVPPKQWQWYIDMDVTGLQEQDILKKAIKSLKVFVKSVLKGLYETESSNTETVS